MAYAYLHLTQLTELTLDPLAMVSLRNKTISLAYTDHIAVTYTQTQALSPCQWSL